MENPNFDPGLALGKTAIKLIQLIFAFCTALLVGMTYLAYQGKLSDWRIQFNFSFWKFEPEPQSVFWHTLFFIFATIACMTCFFVSRWLEKKI